MSFVSAGSFGISGSGPDDLPDPRLDGVPARLDDVADPPYPFVQRADLDQVVEDRLGAWEAGQPADRGRQRRRRLAVRRAQADAWVRLEVEEPPVDLDVGRTLADRLDRRAERLVVEDAAVDEPRPGGRELRELVDAEEPLFQVGEVDRAIAAEPASSALRS